MADLDSLNLSAVGVKWSERGVAVSDQVVGAHLLGPEYGELIKTFGLAIKLGLTVRYRGT